jgi:hypothetical protein
LHEAGLIGDEDFVGDGLREDIVGHFNIAGGDLEADASDEVGDLPVESNEVFVFQETEDPGGFNDGAGDEGL